MIFGKTRYEKRRAKMERLEKKLEKHQTGWIGFALIPTRLWDDRWIWLQHYQYSRSGRIYTGQKLRIDWYRPTRAFISEEMING